MFRPLLAFTLSLSLIMESQSADAVRIEVTAKTLEITVRGEGRAQPGHAVYIALDIHAPSGSAVLPFEKGAEGSTVFLPLRADRLYFAILRPDGPAKLMRLHQQTMWSTQLDVTPRDQIP